MFAFKLDDGGRLLNAEKHEHRILVPPAPEGVHFSCHTLGQTYLSLCWSEVIPHRSKLILAALVVDFYATVRMFPYYARKKNHAGR